MQFIGSLPATIAQPYLEQNVNLQSWKNYFLTQRHQQNMFCYGDLKHNNCDKSLGFLFFSGQIFIDYIQR